MRTFCRWCSAFIEDEEYMRIHEETHIQLDLLNGDVRFTEETESEEGPGTAEVCTEETESEEGPVTAKVNIPVDLQCKTCFKSFTRLDNLRRHKTTCQNAEHPHVKTLSCSKCNQSFARKDNKIRHEARCEGRNHVCPTCNKRCFTTHGLKQHTDWHKTQSKGSSSSSTRQSSRHPANRSQFFCRQCTKRFSSTKDLIEHSMSHHHDRSSGQSNTTQRYRCRRCTECFQNRKDLYIHGIRNHYQVGGALQPRPWNEQSAPWNRGDGDEELRRVYEANAPLILEEHRRDPIHSVYNFPLDNDVNIDQLMRYADDIYRQEQRAFRLNLVFGVILQNRETGEYRYFVPYNNNGIFERPLYVSRRRDLDRLRLRLQQRDILTDILRVRPDTKWIPVLVTNVHFTVYTTFYPLGNGDLPDYLLRKDSIFPLVKSRLTGKRYNDDLCAFRCLALHREFDIRHVNGPAKEFHREWRAHSHSEQDGISLEDFPAFEKLFRVNLEVYSLQEDGFARSIYKSRGLQKTTMYLNMYENHLSYIKNFSMYAQKYQCNTCERHFDHAGNLHRHQKSCANKTKFVYPGGFHQANENIFEKLDQYDIHVPEDQRTFPWFLCFDFESLLQKVNDQPTEFLKWTQKHVPISVSICSNVEDHTEPLCIVESDQDLLVQQMIEAMNHIATTVYGLAKEKWGWVLEAIDENIRKSKDLELDVVADLRDEEEDEDEEEADKEPSHPLHKICGQLETYMFQVPVLGFNSAKYDLNLVKRCLAKHLNMHEGTGTFVVKNNNAYTCIATESLKFLDMSQFLAPGSSYAGFLKAYHVEEKKGFFPYEWFDDVSKLESTVLPPHEAFYSHLKGSNVSESEYQFYQQVWRDNRMTVFRDFLVWYNNLDVGPFVEAVKNFQRYYFEKGIDVFKTAISIPGIARQLLFRTARSQNANFALFDKHNEDLYRTVKRNIVGGPSIIFTRHHCAGQTRIRGQKLCGTVLGFDANALYLQAIGQPMPVGPFVRRLADNEFRPELRDKYMSAYYWMDWLAHTRGLPIQHKLNKGYEVKIGKYPVDGFVPATNQGDKGIVFQFHGCYWHGHLCDVTKGIRNEKWLDSRTQKYQKTLDTTAFLKRDHHVIEMWECQFRQYCRQNPAIYDFINGMRPGFFRHHKSKITENTILEGVVKEELFGMVEVDIEVPEQWPGYFRHPTMSPYQYFQEMSPLFCTSEIPYEAIGEHMQSHIMEQNLSDKPRRLLVGGMKARQILLATPLLRWYLNHGMDVTKIYQVVEFQQQRCFKEFVKEVSEARRMGDRDPDTAIIADTKKVEGNSAYGSLIMDKTKHREVRYIQGENETCLKINDPLFQKLDCLDPEEQYYEVEMAKRKIRLDLPIQLGYYILQYAKLRMLEFYFDFMDQYVDRSDFEYCEMDTDSAYMAIAGSSLEQVIKPEMREKYQRGLKGFCTESDIEADAQDHWFPRNCCPEHAKYDKRTPGLFKLEYQGDEMIGLCSKTYIVRKSKTVKPSLARLAAYKLVRRSSKLKLKRCPSKPKTVNEYKFSSKGVSKRHLKAPMSKFRQVLKTGKAQSGYNRGFRVRNNSIFTYSQERRGFSYLYCKRKVLDDGIHTVPLDITLCPLSVEEREVRDQELVDMLANNFE